MTDSRTAEGPAPLALFDLDHTLLDGDSNTLWLDFLIAQGHLGPEAVTTQADYMAQYGAGRLDIRDYLGFHLRLLAGRPVSDWLPVRQAFIAQCIQPRIPAAARQAVARHRQLGHRAAIITATHEFLSTAIGALFELPVIAPRGKVVAGRFSGEFEEPVCFREHKLTCLENWQRENGLSAGHVAARHFYSDSANDLPLLEAVDHPVVVNADPALAQIALARGWQAATWRCA